MIKPDFRQWEREDLERLYDMSINNCSISKMSRAMNRSRKSTISALKRMQTQQALFYPIHDVAVLHGMNVEDFYHHLKDPLFYIEPPRKNDVPMLLIVTTFVFGIVSLYGSFFYKDI